MKSNSKEEFPGVTPNYTISESYIRHIMERLDAIYKLLEGSELSSLPVRFKDEIQLLKELHIKNSQLQYLQEDFENLRKEHIKLKELLKNSL